MSTPSGSRGRGRPPVPLDRIVATAIALLNDEGADALSMRTLAQRLGSGTATLYRHFEGRPQLIAHVVDEMFAEMAAHPGVDDSDVKAWQDSLATAARTMFEVLRRNPNVAPLMIENTPVGPHALALRERALAMLLDAGFDAGLAVRAWVTVARYVLGFAAQLRTDDPAIEQVAAWEAVDPADFPASMAVAAEVPVPLEEEFTFGLTMLIAGLETAVGESSVTP
ncbi:TetR/AcrR family transcriptional regulator [Williamsia herbipolensis]|uniref:TetR/AcrR family transcriptional regulator n=1 Tax=Williamsia herbipolensis TaxID=1603258 RepID=UPI0005F88CDA|nr:TetR/AcrR family transcriptional regulator [Williamsia herbipolensis]